MRITVYIGACALDLFTNGQAEDVRGYTEKVYGSELAVELDSKEYHFAHFRETSLEKIARGDKDPTRDYLLITRKSP